MVNCLIFNHNLTLYLIMFAENMFCSLALGLLVVSQVQSQLIFQDNSNPIANISIDIPEIKSPYSFSTNSPNLDVIQNNLNPQLNQRQGIPKLELNGSQIQLQKQKQTQNQPLVQQKNDTKQQIAKVEQNNSTNTTLEQNNQKNNKTSQNITSTHPLQPILIDNPETEVKLEKIDIKKLMKQIENQLQNNSLAHTNQPAKVYQKLFRTIDQSDINNQAQSKANISTQSVINNSAKIQKQTLSVNQTIDSNIVNQESIKQQLSGQNTTVNSQQYQQISQNMSSQAAQPRPTQKQPASNQQTHISQQQQTLTTTQTNNQSSSVNIGRVAVDKKQLSQQSTQQQIQPRLSSVQQLQLELSNHKKEKQSIQSQLSNYKNKYQQLLKQLEQHKRGHITQQQQKTTNTQQTKLNTQKPTTQQKVNLQKQTKTTIQPTLCIDIKTAIFIGGVLLILLLFWVLKWKRFVQREVVQQFSDRQKLSSDDQVD